MYATRIFQNVRKSPACIQAGHFNIEKMNKETKNYLDNIDAWIKQIRTEFSNITDTSQIVAENVDLTQHNYELIYELKDQIDRLKGEIKALKLMQLLMLKNKIRN